MRCLRIALFKREDGSLLAGLVTTFVVGAMGVGGAVVHVAMMEIVEKQFSCSTIALWEKPWVCRERGESHGI